MYHLQKWWDFLHVLSIFLIFIVSASWHRAYLTGLWWLICDVAIKSLCLFVDYVIFITRNNEVDMCTGACVCACACVCHGDILQVSTSGGVVQFTCHVLMTHEHHFRVHNAGNKIQALGFKMSKEWIRYKNFNDTIWVGLNMVHVKQ